jgi:hypothetical protein
MDLGEDGKQYLNFDFLLFKKSDFAVSFKYETIVLYLQNVYEYRVYS